jgi:hypothetical protein
VRTLLVGCSFVQGLDLAVNNDCANYRVIGRSGSGNQALAARVLYECSREKFNRVIVIWSGVNRIDIPIPLEVHDTFPKDDHGDPCYKFYTLLDPVVWYHSGGFCLSGTSEKCPSPVRSFFKQQYLGATPRYLADLTLGAIITTQGFLQKQGIPHDMTWIYDVDRSDLGERNEPGCGQLDRTSPLHTLVDWNRFSQHQTIFEHCQANGQLMNDGFHPKSSYLMSYLNHCFGLNLTPLDRSA